MRMVPTGDAAANGVGSFRGTALLVAALGGLVAVPSFPAHADVFDHTLLVNGHSGTVEVLKVTVRVEWTLPAVDPDEGGRSWQLRVGTRALTCGGGDSTAIVAGAPITFISTLRGHHDLDLSGPDFLVGSSYFVRACLPLASGRHHDTGEGGTDQYSIALANGWRFHDLQYSHGEAGMPVPTWSLRGGGPTHPHIQVQWRNPGGVNVHHHYGYRLYIVGPAGVPHR